MIRAAFIGIDRYEDSRIRELGGARRDASALWALFTDSVPGAAFVRLTDSEATLAEIRSALDATFDAATADDVVILMLAGHGTHEYQFVAHDTDLDRLGETTLPMADIADRFRRTSARAALCVLDCCFSGGAPGRVLEDSPVSRNPAQPLDLFIGQGRILLAACGQQESAFELPAKRHGVLTFALLEALQEANGEGLVSVIEDAINRARAEATRLGRTQTPVMLGYIEGGLTLPRLTRGPVFAREFPEIAGIRVTPAIADLSACGLPADLLTVWAAQFRDGLNDLQLEAVNDYRILDGESLFVVAPTTSGKTFVGELAAARAIVDGRKAVFLLPYRALVNEKYQEFSALYAKRLDMRVIRCSGDYQDETGEFLRGRYDLALLTYETFLSLSLSFPSLLNQLGLVVIDEAHFIADPTRGIIVELLLANVLRARTQGLVPQLIALSAVVGDVNCFNEWLSCKVQVSGVRPVPLVEGVLDRGGTYQHVDADGRESRTQLIPAFAIHQRGEKPSSQDVLVPLVNQLLASNPAERILIFRNTKGSTQGCAKYLARDLRLPAATPTSAALPLTDISTAGNGLRECLQGGTAFHNSDLARDEREVIEAAFRDPTSNVRVLVATSGVAAGVNTPASTVIIAETAFRGETDVPYSVAVYKNMAGRAGRKGLSAQGRSILLADGPGNRDALFRRYVLGTPEPICSAFEPRDLDTWILRLLAQVPQVRRDQAVQLLAGTYSGFLAARRDPSWSNATQVQLTALLDRMLTLGLLEQEGDMVHLTVLGRACGRSTLSFESALRLVELLKARTTVSLSADELLVLIQALPESDDQFTPLFKKGDKERAWIRQASQTIGQSAVRILQSRALDEWVWCARCKRALIVRAWIDGVALDGIERRYSLTLYQPIGSGNIRGFADNARMHLRPAYQIACALLLDAAPTAESIDALSSRLEAGVPEDAVPLLDFPIRLHRGELLALHARGIRRPDEVWQMDEDKLTTVLRDTNRAKLLERYRPAEQLSEVRDQAA